jgi:hypothetical protein
MIVLSHPSLSGPRSPGNLPLHIRFHESWRGHLLLFPFLNVSLSRRQLLFEQAYSLQGISQLFF